MQGFWTLPDCRNPETYAIYSRFFRLMVSPGASWLERLQSIQDDAKFSRIRTSEDTFLAYTTNDGIMELSVPSNPQDYSPGQDWDIIKHNGSYHEYMRCYEIDPPQHGPGVAAMEYLDDISALCNAGFEEGCAPYLFTAADRDKDGKLSEKEIAGFLEMIAYLATVAHGPLTDEELAQEMSLAYQKAPLVSRILMIGRDKNHSQTLESDELRDLHSHFPQHEAASYFAEKVRAMTLIFRNPGLLLNKPQQRLLTVSRPDLTPLPPSLSDRLSQPPARSAE